MRHMVRWSLISGPLFAPVTETLEMLFYTPLTWTRGDKSHFGKIRNLPQYNFIRAAARTLPGLSIFWQYESQYKILI